MYRNISTEMYSTFNSQASTPLNNFKSKVKNIFIYSNSNRENLKLFPYYKEAEDCPYMLQIVLSTLPKILDVLMTYCQFSFLRGYDFVF